MQLGKFRSSQLSMCKVQRVKGLQVGITWGDFHEDARRQHTTGTKNLISTKFQTLDDILVKEEAMKVYASVYSAWRIIEEKLNCFYCHFPGTLILMSALTWKISSGIIQFRQQKVVWLEREAVAHLPAYRLQMPPAPPAVVCGLWLPLAPCPPARVALQHQPPEVVASTMSWRQRTSMEAAHYPGKSSPAPSGDEPSLTASQLVSGFTFVAITFLLILLSSLWHASPVIILSSTSLTLFDPDNVDQQWWNQVLPFNTVTVILIKGIIPFKAPQRSIQLERFTHFHWNSNMESIVFLFLTGYD